MKFLLIPLDFHRHNEDPLLFTDMVNGFSLQGETMLFTTMDAAIQFKPDVIFYQGSLSNSECNKLKQKTGALFTMWTGDTRYLPVESLMELRDVVDAYFIPFSGTLMERYKIALGKPCYFIYEPLHDWKLRAPKQMTGGYTCFVGNTYDSVPGGDQRTDILQFIKQRTNFEGRGTGPWSKGKILVNDVPNFYNNAYITICENNYHDIKDYFTPRNLLAMGAGSCAVMKVFNGIDSLFKDMHHCIYYRHKHELLHIIEFLERNPTERNRIAMNGYQHAQNFTYKAFARMYRDVIEKNIKPTIPVSEK